MTKKRRKELAEIFEKTEHEMLGNGGIQKILRKINTYYFKNICKLIRIFLK